MGSRLELLDGAFDWIRSVAVPAPGGLTWCEEGEPFDDLYSGTAGVLLGCAQARSSGLNLADIADIAAAAVARLSHLATNPGTATLPDDGLFSGWAGVPVALRAWSSAADDPHALSAAEQVTRQIAQRLLGDVLSGQPPHPCPDIISGDAGLLLMLLADPHATTSEAAQLLADRLVASAEPATVGLQWRMGPKWEHLMPGFSHGTAGVAYALVAASQQLKRPDLLETAVLGAEELLLLGHTPDGWALPLSIPRQLHRPAVFYGWCHGPTGTIRLFLALNEIDPQPRWEQAIAACLQALRESELPKRVYPGYWDNLGRCCGTAGVGQLLVERYQATGDPALLEWAEVLASDVLARAVVSDTGVSWSNTEHARDPSQLPAEPGFMQGASGIAGWLAQLEAVKSAGHATPAGLRLGWI
ncbi:lanthionine synthetase-like protein [Jatrophihabitans sp. GAS493]|uniref:lanthionine synthetase LanC family protein n=1 Tax=Jatrophihabitans sp. GAS493 TaxID=1907575 RepID=UPI000BBF3FC3|nr:lanthionine synthetase LanC family protein [Jatrophihabitans sp. GAS493]SOD72819.1 lanthionine synthetase-like protein [Jatrophihabitans sp. GAS493]